MPNYANTAQSYLNLSMMNFKDSATLGAAAVKIQPLTGLNLRIQSYSILLAPWAKLSILHCDQQSALKRKNCSSLRLNHPTGAGLNLKST